MDDNQVKENGVEESPEVKNFDSNENSGPSLEQQLLEMKDKWVRAVAEMENLRKRAQKDREDALKYGAMSFAKDMVTVADSIDMALKNKPSDENLPESVKAFVDGVEMIAKTFVQAFEKQNLKKVDSLHKPFDPNHHQAMFEAPHEDHENGIVVEILQEGYTLHDRLVRPALVGVCKK
jgi:molecular chaperone GrpE